MYYRYNNLEILNNLCSPYKYLKDLNILLIRHGESECNFLQNECKNLEIPLTEDKKIEDSLIKLTSNRRKSSC